MGSLTSAALVGISGCRCLAAFARAHRLCKVSEIVVLRESSRTASKGARLKETIEAPVETSRGYRAPGKREMKGDLETKGRRHALVAETLSHAMTKDGQRRGLGGEGWR
jgi:hypothetical protein